MNVLRKKPKPPATHSHHDEYASISLASSALQSPLARIENTSGGWQKKAWDFYDVVPETRLVVGYRAAALSKVKLKIGLITPDGIEDVDSEQSQAMLDTLFGGVVHHGECLARYAQHLTIVGETFTFVVKRDGKEEWLIVPPDQVDTTQSTVSFQDPVTGIKETHDPKKLFSFRLWDPHPHKFWEADSPTRGGISTLDNIMHLTASIKATAVSRLVGRGILPWPLEAKLPDTTSTQKNSQAENGLQKQLYDAMTAAIRDPGSAAAAAPIISWMPGEMIQYLKDKPIDFSTVFDEHVAELRDTEIRRYAAGQPLPSEMVTGIGGVSHWTAWHVAEEDLKFDIAPLASTICSALSLRVVQPLMGEMFVVLPDFNELVTRPNRTPEAIQMFEKGIISRGEAREAAGYPADDVESDEVDQEASAESEAPIAVESDRMDPPAELERGTPESFAAEVITRDVLDTAGRWLKTHCGRENRRRLVDVAPSDTHLHVTPDLNAVLYAAGRAREKYAGAVPCDVLDACISTVEGMYEASDSGVL